MRLQHLAGELAAAPVLGQAEIHPAALRRALHQARLGQQLQVAADARLALPQDARQVLDVELAVRQQDQQAQPRRLGHRLQHADRGPQVQGLTFSQEIEHRGII